jgi:hypothetical protein
MPPQQGGWRRDRGDLPQRRTADSVRSRGEPTAIIVRETEPTFTKLTPQEPVLFNQVRDDLALPPLQPAGQYTQHRCSAAKSITRRSLYHGSAKDVARLVEHYGHSPISSHAEFQTFLRNQGSARYVAYGDLRGL